MNWNDKDIGLSLDHLINHNQVIHFNYNGLDKSNLTTQWKKVYVVLETIFSFFQFQSKLLYFMQFNYTNEAENNPEAFLFMNKSFQFHKKSYKMNLLIHFQNCFCLRNSFPVFLHQFFYLFFKWIRGIWPYRWIRVYTSSSYFA